jgi:hypothetical protein
MKKKNNYWRIIGIMYLLLCYITQVTLIGEAVSEFLFNWIDFIKTAAIVTIPFVVGYLAGIKNNS